VATSLNNLAALYDTQGLGLCHPTTAMLLENQATVLEALDRADEARPLLDRAKKIQAGECKSN
jgi:hypothetical protein